MLQAVYCSSRVKPHRAYRESPVSWHAVHRQTRSLRKQKVLALRMMLLQLFPTVVPDRVVVQAVARHNCCARTRIRCIRAVQPEEKRKKEMTKKNKEKKTKKEKQKKKLRWWLDVSDRRRPVVLASLRSGRLTYRLQRPLSREQQTRGHPMWPRTNTRVV